MCISYTLEDIRQCRMITAKFSNPVILGLAESNPGIMGLKNCPLNAYKSVIK